MKYQIESLDGLDDAVKALYTEKDGKYVLAVEGLPKAEDVDGLKRKVDELLAEKKDAAKRAKEAEEAARAAAEESAKKSGDVDALEKSWQEKLAKREAELKGQIESMQSSITTMTVDNVAVKLASELAVPGSADVLMPHIKSRLSAEMKDGQYVTVVRDKDGKPSASTLEELKTEFVSNQAFAPLIAGNKANGGGAAGGGSGGAAKANMLGDKSERVAAIKAKFPQLEAR